MKTISILLLLMTVNLRADDDVYNEYINSLISKINIITNEKEAMKHLDESVAFINKQGKIDRHIPKEWIENRTWSRHYYDFETRKWRHLVLMTLLPLEMYIRNEDESTAKKVIHKDLRAFYDNYLIMHPMGGTGEDITSACSRYLKARLIYACMNIENKKWGARHLDMSEELEELSEQVREKLDVYGW